MNKKDLKNRINKDFNSIPVPNVLETLQSQRIDVSHKEAEVGKVRKFNYRIAIAMSFVVLLIVAIFPVYRYVSFDETVYATVSLDINPSIAIEINQDNKVIALNALNEDADIIINEDYKRKDIEKVLENILDKAHNKGYDNSVVLYGIDCEDSNYKVQLKQRIQNRTVNYYNARNINGNPIWEQETDTDNLDEQASYYGVSRAKLSIIYKAQAKHPEYSIEELQEMNMRQLQQLMKD